MCNKFKKMEMSQMTKQEMKNQKTQNNAVERIQYSQERLNRERILKLEGEVKLLKQELLRLRADVARLQKGKAHNVVQDNENITRENINNLLTELGLSYSAVGREYICEAIMYCKDKKDIMLCHDIYPSLAKTLETTQSGIEKGIRMAIIDIVANKTEKFNEIFGITDTSRRGKLTNKELIKGLINYLK